MAIQKKHEEHEQRISENSPKKECSEKVFATNSLPFDPSFSPLPSNYDMDMLVVMSINPWQVFCYWEISKETLEKFKTSLGETDFSSCNLELSLYLKDRKTSAFPKKTLWQSNVEDAGESCNWYITLDSPVNYEYPLDNYYAELGYRCPNGIFQALVNNIPVNEKLKKPPEAITLEKEKTATSMEPSTLQQLDEKLPWTDIELEAAFEVKGQEAIEIESKLDSLYDVISIEEAVNLMKTLELSDALNVPEESFRDYFEKKLDELTKPPEEEEPAGSSRAPGSGKKGK